jgi:murein DD-endopeptidase
MRLKTLRFTWVVGLLCGGALAGCSVVPSQTQSQTQTQQRIEVQELSLGQRIAQRAVELQGRPYQYGGNGPETFDCSGLVGFVHREVGINTPRTTLEQFKAARPVAMGEIEPGDLLFFKINDRSVSHVAIYAGEGRFVHAPQTGRPVETRNIDDPYYVARLVGVGRLH